MRVDNFFVGFDNFARTFHNTVDYPRYNIIKDFDDGYKVQVALPGWEASQIKVTLHSGVLTIKGEKQSDEEIQWVHRGISGKSFERSFKLDTDLEVASAKFLNGLLTITLRYAESTKPIEIQVQ